MVSLKNAMKKILLILLTTAVTSLQAIPYKYLGDYTLNTTIPSLESPEDNVSIETLGMIYISLPEPYPFPTYKPFTTSIDKFSISTSKCDLSTDSYIVIDDKKNINI